ncbi:MAG: hypothetical protein ABIO72_03590 [Patescibacteria group bacterium]
MSEKELENYHQETLLIVKQGAGGVYRQCNIYATDPRYEAPVMEESVGRRKKKAKKDFDAADVWLKEHNTIETANIAKETVLKEHSLPIVAKLVANAQQKAHDTIETQRMKSPQRKPLQDEPQVQIRHDLPLPTTFVGKSGSGRGPLN